MSREGNPTINERHFSESPCSSAVQTWLLNPANPHHCRAPNAGSGKRGSRERRVSNEPLSRVPAFATSAEAPLQDTGMLAARMRRGGDDLPEANVLERSGRCCGGGEMSSTVFNPLHGLFEVRRGQRNKIKVGDTGVSSLRLPRGCGEKRAQDRTKIAKTACSRFRKHPSVESFSLLKFDESAEAHEHPAGALTFVTLLGIICQRHLTASQPR